MDGSHGQAANPHPQAHGTREQVQIGQCEGKLTEQTDRAPSSIRDAILTAVATHSGTRPADDDRTVMVLRFEQFRTALSATPQLLEETAAV